MEVTKTGRVVSLWILSAVTLGPIFLCQPREGVTRGIDAESIPEPGRTSTPAGALFLLPHSPVCTNSVDGPCPGSETGYQVNFQLPENVPSGITELEILTGFIPTRPVQLPLR